MWYCPVKSGYLDLCSVNYTWMNTMLLLEKQTCASLLFKYSRVLNISLLPAGPERFHAWVSTIISVRSVTLLHSPLTTNVCAIIFCTAYLTR